MITALWSVAALSLLEISVLVNAMIKHTVYRPQVLQGRDSSSSGGNVQFFCIIILPYKATGFRNGRHFRMGQNVQKRENIAGWRLLS